MVEVEVEISNGHKMEVRFLHSRNITVVVEVNEVVEVFPRGRIQEMTMLLEEVAAVVEEAIQMGLPLQIAVDPWMLEEEGVHLIVINFLTREVSNASNPEFLTLGNF